MSDSEAAEAVEKTTVTETEDKEVSETPAEAEEAPKENTTEADEKADDDDGTEEAAAKEDDAKEGETADAKTEDGDKSEKVAADKSAKPARKLYREDFDWGEVIGEGAYGEVQLATVKETGISYAVKILNKKHIIAQKKVPWVNREKFLLDKLRHPNIVDLFYTFSDPDHLHFVLELCPNGELLDEVRKHGALNLDCVRFCSAEILSACRFMHEKHGVAHRDLKPENVLIGRGGHMKLVDFGTAKELGNRAARSKSFVGTAEYVSPELLRDKEAGLAADLWSVGCMIYQLLCGKPPFRAPNEYLTFQQILNREVAWPENVDAQAKDLIEQLLDMDPNSRLGNREPGGYDELQSHPFFASIDWDSLPSQTPPPFAPPPEMPSWPVKKEAPPPEPEESEEDKRLLERANKLEAQKSSPWASFLTSDELILHTSLISKKKGLFAYKRQLILTDTPRLIYVDPEKMVVKGEIPWSQDLKVEFKTDKVFSVSVPGRVYKLDECSGEARKWVDIIQETLTK